MGPSPERAPRRSPMPVFRPFRARACGGRVPEAVPRAILLRPFGAEDSTPHIQLPYTYQSLFARAARPAVVLIAGGPMSDTDTALVRRARDGDRPAFEELVRRTSRLVFARLYLDTGDGHRAEDLLQETYLLAFRSLRRLEDPAGFRPWLLTIAHRVLIDAARRDARQKRAAPPRSDAPLA